MSLGSLLNGQSAGYISLVDAAFWPSWSAVYTPSILSYESPNPTEVVVFRDGGALDQIIANEVIVDVVTVNSTKFEIRCYTPAQKQGLSWPFTFSGDPFEVYTIEQGSTATSLKITREHRDVTATTGSFSIVRSEVMSITRSGTWPAFNWVLSDWTKVSEPVLTERTETYGGTQANRTATLTVRPPGGTSRRNAYVAA